jgi:hypothetical protein
MLQPAHVGHLALLRALIHEGAAEGSFDRGLAADSTEASEFFDKLKRALVTGYFVEQDARTGRIDTVAVPGYVFWPDDRHSGMPPVGFGLFRALDSGYELWLAGLEFARRGDGNGRALLEALFATPPGQKTYVVRVQRASRWTVVTMSLRGKDVECRLQRGDERGGIERRDDRHWLTRATGLSSRLEKRREEALLVSRCAVAKAPASSTRAKRAQSVGELGQRSTTRVEIVAQLGRVLRNDGDVRAVAQRHGELVAGQRRRIDAAQSNAKRRVVAR